VSIAIVAVGDRTHGIACTPARRERSAGARPAADSTVSIVDSQRFVDSNVRRSLPVMPSRITVSCVIHPFAQRAGGAGVRLLELVCEPRDERARGITAEHESNATVHQLFTPAGQIRRYRGCRIANTPPEGHAFARHRSEQNPAERCARIVWIARSKPRAFCRSRLSVRYPSRPPTWPRPPRFGAEPSPADR
jgi:hypothetical protein